ncbi:hypothetical protein [Streptomyces sp. MBT60]|uniref:hypothetical protein n=1 Tax=Streptomyces sp. MBT60 TaxID=2800409 RepID=UPI00190BD62F|nr:hypothetical protein [Streptomyces sp. MBT60]MBK3542528.1 hypothetical protein [Streptomyces sp. MBT60]
MTFAPRLWVVGEVVSAAIMNQEIRDQFNSMFDVWTPYTPVWTSSGTNPNIGNGTVVARYMKVGRTCRVVVRQTMGSTTTYGTGAYLWTLPFTASSAATIDYLGSARLTGSDAWFGQCVASTGGTQFSPVFPASATNTRSATQSGTVPETLAAGHVLRMSLEYQTAT